MNKIYIMLGIVFLLSISLVSAGQNGQVLGSTCATVAPDSRDACCQQKGFQNFDVNEQKCKVGAIAEKVANQEQVKLYQSNVTGLENAMIRVRNQETAQHLQQVMAKIQTKTMTKLKEMNSLTFTVNSNGDAIAEGKKEAKFLGFINMEKKYYCKMLENGSAERQKTVFEYLFKDVDKNPCEMS